MKIRLALGRADNIKGCSLAQEADVGLADHAAVHDTDALGLTEALFHMAHDVFDGGHVSAVDCEDLEVYGQPLRRPDQPEKHLLAVTALVARVAPGALGVLFRLPFKIRARDLVEQAYPLRNKLVHWAERQVTGPYASSTVDALLAASTSVAEYAEKHGEPIYGRKIRRLKRGP
jgi:hypothetical protein